MGTACKSNYRELGACPPGESDGLAFVLYPSARPTMGPPIIADFELRSWPKRKSELMLNLDAQRREEMSTGVAGRDFCEKFGRLAGEIEFLRHFNGVVMRACPSSL